MPGSVERLHRRIAMTMALLVVVGCASTPSGSGDDLRDAAARAYPEARYVTAWGSSPAGFAEAELDARAAVAAQVQSSISATTEVHATAHSRDGAVTDRQSLRSSVTTRTEFQRAELIETPTRFRAEDDSRFRVLAVLDRTEYAAEIRSEYENVAVTFRSAAARVLDDDTTDAWGTATTRFDALRALAREHFAVMHHHPTAWTDDLDTHRRLQQWQQSALARTRVGVRVVASSGGPDATIVERHLREALRRSGLEDTTGDCRNDASIVLTVRPELRWQQLLGSRYCTLRLVGTLDACDPDRRAQDVVIEASDLEGRGDRPVAALERALDAAVLRPGLMDVLAGVLPVAQRGTSR